MKAVVRGAAMAAVLALTGCGEGESPSAGSERATSVPGETQKGAASPETVSLDPTGLMHALPTELSVGDAFGGGDPFMAQSPAAVRFCAKETGAACTGLVAIGGKDLEAGGDSDDMRVEFKLYSFETAEQAGVVMKSLADKERESAAESGNPSAPVALDSGADETDAFQNDMIAMAVMRIGTVVASASTGSPETEQAALDHVASVQVERVRTVAAGENPDF